MKSQMSDCPSTSLKHDSRVEGEDDLRLLLDPMRPIPSTVFNLSTGSDSLSLDDLADFCNELSSTGGKPKTAKMISESSAKGQGIIDSRMSSMPVLCSIHDKSLENMEASDPRLNDESSFYVDSSSSWHSQSSMEPSYGPRSVGFPADSQKTVIPVRQSDPLRTHNNFRSQSREAGQKEALSPPCASRLLSSKTPGKLGRWGNADVKDMSGPPRLPLTRDSTHGE
jgi:hypothetical protein